jgi:transcriptional regulator with XRE-family HTH domain
MDLSERINELLKERKWTYYKLHKMSGVPKSTVEHIVKGTRKTTSHENIQKIADAFNLTVSDLLGETTPNLENCYVEVAKIAQDRKIDPARLLAIIELFEKDENK